MQVAQLIAEIGILKISTVTHCKNCGLRNADETMQKPREAVYAHIGNLFCVSQGGYCYDFFGFCSARGVMFLGSNLHKTVF